MVAGLDDEAGGGGAVSREEDGCGVASETMRVSPFNLMPSSDRGLEDGVCLRSRGSGG